MEDSSINIHKYPSTSQATWELSNIDYLNSRDIEKQEMINNSLSNKDEINVKVPAEEGQTALHVAVQKGHLEMVRLLLEGGANVNKADVRGCTPKSLAKQQANKSIYDLVLSHENRRNEHKIEFIEPETTDGTSTGRHPGREVKKLLRRVTIHANFQKSISDKQLPKLIVLPDSLAELLTIAGQKFGGQNFTKVVNSENAEVDDLSVIRDGDHLFLLPNDC
nr:potassium channel KAT3-like [Tanacetum cinerariifolium]